MTIGAITAGRRKGGRGLVARYKIGKPHRPFGRFPAEADLCRLLASSGKGLAATYLVIASHANATFECFPGVERIAELAGTCSRRVRETFRTLESMGLLVVTVRRKSQGRLIVCRLTSHHAQAGVSEGKHRSVGEETPVVACTNTGLSVTQEKTLEKSAEQIRTASSAAGLKASGSIEEALTAADIRNPARTRLVSAFAGIPNAVAMIRDIVGSVQSRGGQTGVIIIELTKSADRETRARVRRRQQQARDNAVTEELHKEEDRIRTSNSVLFERLRAIPRDEWPRLKELALASEPPFHRRMLAEADPQKNPMLAGAMIRAWEAQDPAKTPKPSGRERVDEILAI